MNIETLILQAVKRLSSDTHSRCEVLSSILAILECNTLEDIDVHLLLGRNTYKSLVFPSIELAFSIFLLSIYRSGSNFIAPGYLCSSLNHFLSKEAMQKLGMNVIHYSDSSEIVNLIDDSTGLIIVDLPNPITYKTEDITEIIKVAKHSNILTIMHNSMLTPLYCKPLEYGFDISIYKMLGVGVLGISNPDLYKEVFATYKSVNIQASKRCKLLDILCLLPLVFKRRREIAIAINNWIISVKIIKNVFFLGNVESESSVPYDARFKSNASLITVVFHKKYHDQSVEGMFKHMRVFSISEEFNNEFSNIFEIKNHFKETAMRISCGLEDEGMLIDDLRRGFERLKMAEEVYED